MGVHWSWYMDARCRTVDSERCQGERVGGTKTRRPGMQLFWGRLGIQSKSLPNIYIICYAP